MFELTGSSAAVGAVGLAQLVPLVLGTLLLGPIIDSVDRRKLLIVADTGQALASGLLLLGTLAGDPPLALVYVGVAISAGFSAVQLATRSAIVPNLVPEAMLPSALALNQVMWNTAMIAGPAIGGVIVGRFGLGWAYGIDLVSFVAGILSAVLMSPRPPIRRPPPTRPATGGSRWGCAASRRASASSRDGGCSSRRS